MTDLARLLKAAYKTERAAARRLGSATGVTEEQALRATLERSAGAAGLAALLAQRESAAAAAAARLEQRIAQRTRAVALRQARHDGAPSPWRAWFDGSAHPNPGRCGIGALLTGPGGERVEISRAAGYGNSSEAEYRALIALLEAAVRGQAHGLTIYGDSRVVIDDVNGPAFSAAASLAAHRQAALALLAQLRDVTLRWVPRHKNAAADALSQRAARASSIEEIEYVERIYR